MRADGKRWRSAEATGKSCATSPIEDSLMMRNVRSRERSLAGGFRSGTTRVMVPSRSIPLPTRMGAPPARRLRRKNAQDYTSEPAAAGVGVVSSLNHARSRSSAHCLAADFDDNEHFRRSRCRAIARPISDLADHTDERSNVRKSQRAAQPARSCARTCVVPKSGHQRLQRSRVSGSSNTGLLRRRKLSSDTITKRCNALASVDVARPVVGLLQAAAARTAIDHRRLNHWTETPISRLTSDLRPGVRIR